MVETTQRILISQINYSVQLHRENESVIDWYKHIYVLNFLYKYIYVECMHKQLFKGYEGKEKKVHEICMSLSFHLYNYQNAKTIPNFLITYSWDPFLISCKLVFQSMSIILFHDIMTRPTSCKRLSRNNCVWFDPNYLITQFFFFFSKNHIFKK